MDDKVSYALPCPFCGSLSIKYSLKVAGDGYRNRYYNAQCYCTKCNTYGPRVKSKKIEGDYNRSSVEKDVELKMAAEKAWNTRVK